MITRIKLENFKSWQSLDAKLRRVTGLFGTNSSGKSSIIQFLLMLKQTREASDRNLSLELNGPYTELGTISDVIFRHENSNKLALSLGYLAPSSLSLYDISETPNKKIVESADVRWRASFDIVGLETSPLKMSHQVGDFRASVERSEDGKKNRGYKLFTNYDEDLFKFQRNQGRQWQLSAPIRGYQFPDQARAYFKNAAFLADLEVEFERIMDRIYYLGPLREYPRRDYLWARSRPVDVGKKGERAIDAILAATSDNELRNLRYKAHHKTFQEMISYWLQRLGLIADFRVAEIAEGSNRWQARVRTDKTGTEVLLTDVGFGVSQILPVITLLYYVPEGSTIILEQPEIHLHPLAQAELADLIISASKRRNLQIILESHSEHLLLRLQRRVAEQEIEASDIALYFARRGKMGRSELEDLQLDLLGHIRNWPEKFMGDAFEEAAQAELARLKRLSREHGRQGH